MKIERRWMLAASSIVVGVGIGSGAACSSSSTEVASNPDANNAVDANQTIDAGADTSLPDSSGTACDPVQQDCADPSLKCTYIKVGTNDVSACEPPSGDPTAQEGETCIRAAIGIDNCVKGTHCFPNGASGVFACRKACATDSQCSAGSKCADLTTLPPYFGVCFPTCTPFSTDCGGGTCANSFGDNDGTNFFEGCRNIGFANVGGACTAQWDCIANMNCFGKNAFTCHLMCDDTHPCGDAGTCTADPGLPNGGGACE